MHYRAKQTGIGLLELMLALAVIAVVVMMSVRYYETARRAQNVNTAITQIRGIVQASTQWVATQYDYATGPTAPITLDKLIQGNYLPSQFKSTNPWNGSITVAPASDVTQVTITLTNVPVGVCNSLATKISSQAVTSQCQSDDGGSSSGSGSNKKAPETVTTFTATF